jgi:hypothetical protein
VVKITNVQNYRARTLKIVLGFLEQYAILSKEGSDLVLGRVFWPLDLDVARLGCCGGLQLDSPVLKTPTEGRLVMPDCSQHGPVLLEVQVPLPSRSPVHQSRGCGSKSGLVTARPWRRSRSALHLLPYSDLTHFQVL